MELGALSLLVIFGEQFIWNSLYETVTLSFQSRRNFSFLKVRWGISQGWYQVKGEKCSTKIKHPILQQVRQNWDFIYFFKQENLDFLSLVVGEQSKEGCQQGMNVGIKGASHPSVLVLHIMGLPTKSQLHSASQERTAGLCVKPPSVSCSCQTLACSSPWREGEGQLSRKEAPWWAWNEGREVCLETSPRGTLINFLIQQTRWADAR